MKLATSPARDSEKILNRTNYIFVDFENIHEVDLDLVADKPVVVILVLGERHKNLPVDQEQDHRDHSAGRGCLQNLSERARRPGHGILRAELFAC